MIQVEGLTFARGEEDLVEKASLSIFSGNKIGLIGKNGCGKSSFFKILLGEIEPEHGVCRIPKNHRFAIASQLIPDSQATALDFVLDGHEPYRRIETQIETALEAHDGEVLGQLYQDFDHIDGHVMPSRAGALLHGLGFSSDEQQKSVNDFSGGWRVRLNLAKALIAPCDTLLLDEPTNHLDLDAIIWLESYLKKYEGTLIIIAHDSAFLDNIVDTIVAVESKDFKRYSGNYSQYIKQRALDLELQQKAHASQEAKRAHLQSFVNRFKAKASKAKQAQSRVKQLERMEQIAAVHESSSFQFEFPPLSKLPDPLISVDRVDMGYTHPILKQVHLTLRPGQRIAFLGKNGAGKSTMIKTMASDLKPLSGEIHSANNLKIGYFSQHQVEQIHLKENAFAHMQALDRSLGEQAIRNFLGGFQFQGDRVFQDSNTLSGGEKARLTLALLVWQNPHILFLDEPTNHLDIEMREALSLALQSYQGALVLVSHDRQLLRETIDELYLIHDAKIGPYDGDIDSYCKWLLNLDKSPAKVKAKKVADKRHSQKEQQKIQSSANKAEQAIERSNREIALIQEKMADNSLYEAVNEVKLKKLQGQLNSLKKDKDEQEKRWFELLEQLEDDNR